MRIKVKVNVFKLNKWVLLLVSRAGISFLSVFVRTTAYLSFESILGRSSRFIQKWRYTCLLVRNPYFLNYFWIFIFGQVELFLTQVLGFTSSSLQPLIFGKTVFLTATLSCAWMSLKYSGKRWNKWGSNIGRIIPYYSFVSNGAPLVWSSILGQERNKIWGWILITTTSKIFYSYEKPSWLNCA